MEEERSVSNGTIHVLRTEKVALCKSLDKQRKEFDIEVERKDTLIDENIEKKNIIQRKNSYIEEQARIAVNTKMEFEKRTLEFKEEKKDLLRHIIQQNEMTNDLSKIILSMRAVVRTSNSYVLPYIYAPGKQSEKSDEKNDQIIMDGNDGKSIVSDIISEQKHSHVPETIIVIDENKKMKKKSINIIGEKEREYDGTEESKIDCDKENDKEEESEEVEKEKGKQKRKEKLILEFKGEKEAEVEVEEEKDEEREARADHSKERVLENIRKYSNMYAYACSAFHHLELY